MTEQDSALFGLMLSNGNGTVNTPICCNTKMKDVGECSSGCCDYYKCLICSKRIRVEWPD